MTFGQDGDFTYEALVDRTNADLANGIGNLASRTHKLLATNFEGKLPEATTDAHVRATVEAAAATATREFEAYGFRRGVEAIREAMGVVDKHISDTKPWALVKDEATRGEAAAVLVTAFEALRYFAVLLAPLLPDSAPRLWRVLGFGDSPMDVDPRTLSWGSTPAGHRIGEAETLFPRLNKEKVMAEINDETKNTTEVEEAKAPAEKAPATQPSGEHETQAAPAPAGGEEEKTYITIDDFVKVELKVGEILEASKIEGADKLLKLKVDLGEGEPRQILAGIAMYYAPETLVGRKIAVVANLKPRKMRGLESQGMLLAASVGDDGKPVLATFTEDVPNGARLR
jgi:methionyl-tRNA synthetase